MQCNGLKGVSKIKVSGRIIGANIGFMSKKPQLTLEINELNDFKQLVDDLNGCEKTSVCAKKLWNITDGTQNVLSRNFIKIIWRIKNE